MMRTTLAVVTAAAIGAALAATAGAKTAGLTGEVGPGFSIEVKKGNQDLKTIRAGTYTIKVEDKSSIHNFHLIGPGVNKKTTVAFKGETTWRIRLKPGRYTYQCDPHAAGGMKGSFRVTR
jgi:plastocyanin